MHSLQSWLQQHLQAADQKASEEKEEPKQNTEESSDASKDAADTEKADQDTADSGELKGSGETLVVGVQPCSFCYPVIYASEKGYFKDAGLDVEYIVFDNGSSMNEGLAAQQLDIGVNGLATIYTVCGGVCDLIAESEAAGTGAIYARPDSDIAKASEIDGMKGSKRDTGRCNLSWSYQYADTAAGLCVYEQIPG